MPFKRCWSCGSDAECYAGCECAKCVDLIGYDDWRRDNPEEYDAWLASQEIEDEEEG